MDSPGRGEPTLRPTVDPQTHEVTFRTGAQPGSRPVSVWFHLREFGADPQFHREGAHWVARIPRPPVDRLEYLFLVESDDGTRTMVTDPGNPHRVRTVFGDKSVVEFPGYRRPWWLDVDEATRAQERRDAAADPGARGLVPFALSPVAHPRPVADGTRVHVGTEPLPHGPGPGDGEGIASVSVHVPGASDQPPLAKPAAALAARDDRARRAALWAGVATGAVSGPELVPDPAIEDVLDAEADVAVTGQLHVPTGSAPEDRLPLLVVHDGPEYADLAQLLRYLTTLGRLEPDLRCRVLLLQPVDRDRSYSASPAYARALVTGMLAQVGGSVRTRGLPVGVGSSLGGLAMLHAATTWPGTFGGVFSQSGSFFRPRTDGMERGYRFYGRIVRYVDDIVADPQRLAGLHVTMTCGTGEENLANNRSLARRLRRAGVPTELIENPDGHNHVGWRDSLDPGLRVLMRTVWGQTGNTPV
jgi:enterochelin esterase-like enzyme